MFTDLSLDFKNLHTPNFAPIHCTVRPRNDSFDNNLSAFLKSETPIFKKQW